jgi:phage recombination protein Bet
MSTVLALNNTMDMWSNEAKLAEIRRMVSPSVPLTDLEFSFLVELGRATQLNPFMREIWAVKYKQGTPASIFLGRDGYRKAAQRQPDYEYHQVNAVYSKDEFKVTNDEIQHSFGFSERGELIGAYCTVKRKSSSRYTYVMVTLKEYNANQSLWNSKPDTMIKKVAEAQALRQAFQEVLSGTYSDAELSQEEPKTLKLVQGTTQTDKLNNLLHDNATIDMSTGEIINKDSYSTGNPDLPISDEQLDEISSLMIEKGFSEERIQKALDYHKVNALEDLTDAKARLFLLQLRKVQ